ncbi:hypothetical protein [Oceanobacillus oncorhynchi]|uniref:hypothetical protein n=1 Tax=Oceanobacillus oncorhynchi TaxID=545501 RepID=UPI0018661B54|nr:hypothetical protein [Oceanobacillus oncorhynchi]
MNQILLVASIFATGLLTGANLDICAKQLPSRHKLGINSYVQFINKADLGVGKILYALVGIGSTLLIIMTTIIFFIENPQLTISNIPLIIAAILTLIHLFCTIKSVPLMLSIESISDNKDLLEYTISRYEKWQRSKLITQTFIFVCLLLFLLYY